MLHILYLVHNLADPAVQRRVRMLEAGGATVALAGFRRGAVPEHHEGTAPVELGRTEDGRFTQRLASVASAAVSLAGKLRHVPRPDVIIGRNLEMLALARRARAAFGGDTPLVYECLDIHRLLLDAGPVGKAMRGAERLFGRDAALLITSSPAFVRDYFVRFGQSAAPVALLPNKVLELDALPAPGPQAALPEAGEPWRIGWFGALRCAKSLDLLAAFTRQAGGRFEVVLRGRPAYREFADFDGFVAAEPHIRFAGPYRNPDDLAAIYGAVHFCWAIDFFEEGLNSAWLLPNRLYEGCRHGVVPIAMQGTETARFLSERGIGVLLEDASVDALQTALSAMNRDNYEAVRRRVVGHDKAEWAAGIGDCRALVERLQALAGSRAGGDILLEAAA
ncbi:glycosyltransferase family 4 protein [Ollibium composti]|uniref:Glycosyltransferase family 4 protein n=1 Tax=Ollibium composti TaxID=2675109 RepID=A0ABY2Q4I0_9HYPH|nr:glycosyltransferase family 4 protein [Mesorhizobium composti]THF55212.1 glycosyltransferase family 4 protein [Mesorhizobium composti]